MWRPRTLRARLVAVAAGAILAAVAVVALVTVIVVNEQLRGSLDTALRQRAQAVAQLAVTAPGVLTDPGALESPVAGREIAGEVVDARGRILARSLTLGARLLPEDRLALAARRFGRSGYENVALDRRPFRLYVAPIAQAGGAAAGGAVLVASDTSDISHTASRVGLLVGLSGAAAVLIAALAAFGLTSHGLGPLRRLAAGAAAIERTADVSRRLPASAVDDEVGRLTGVLNRMLESLEQARAGERRFLADASHELRTPVTALRGNVEYAARHGMTPEVLADLRTDAERLARLVDDLLVLERAGSSRESMRPVDLRELAHELADDDPRLRVLAGGDPVWVRGERDALARAIANLIENALVHGPAEGRVTVAVGSHEGGPMVSVADEGRGPDPESGERVFERFWRGPEAAARPGSGLGLSIVRAIAERHEGRITVAGSRFTIEFPPADQPAHAADAGVDPDQTG